MSKKDKFEKLLRDAGIHEYWCSCGFNPNEDYPIVNIVIPTTNYKLASDILSMYNDYNNYEEDKMCCDVDLQLRGSEFFELVTKDLERRVI